MLKLQPAINLIPKARAKCGEIFCHSSFKDFTICCTLCQMKTFKFEDFLLHIKNVHLINDLEKSLSAKGEINDFLKLDVKSETMSYEKKDGMLCDIENFEIGVTNEAVLCAEESVFRDEDSARPLSSCSEDDDNTESWDEETLKILRKPPKRNIKTKGKQEAKKVQGITDDLKNEPDKCLRDVAEVLQNLTKKSKVLEYICTECNEVFLQKKCLDKHVRELHNGYKCSLCDKRFSRTSHVEYHLKTHTTEKKFICPVESCGRGFVDEDYLKRHLEVHTMERNFICEYENCGKAFQTQRRLASHEYTHRIPKKFVCDMCGYSCRSNPQLVTHQRVHTGEKPFPCEVCNKPFISKIALQEHMISHSEKRPHVCSICNRAFANRRVLVRHKYIHSEEKTFKCKLCESAFKHPNSLQGHMRHVHREPKLRSI